MATAAVVGLAPAKRLLSSSFCPCDFPDKLLAAHEHGTVKFPTAYLKSRIVVRKDPKDRRHASDRHAQAVRAIKVGVESSLSISGAEPELDMSDPSLDVLVLLQKSMLEKQWRISHDPTVGEEDGCCGSAETIGVVRTGSKARERRNGSRRSCVRRRSVVGSELTQSRPYGYIRDSLTKELLSHDEVVCLSKKIKAGLFLEECRERLKLKLGCEPSDKQLASSLRMSCTELQSKLLESFLAREMLAMRNVRLVISIAKKYGNLGAEMSDLIQGGLMGLLQGIEKFDASKGFRISTYVYWWIRRGVSKAFSENCRTMRLPSHLHERLFSIRMAKAKLEEQGISPSIDKIAKVLNISQKKIKTATEADNIVLSIDREPFPASNGLPTDSFHSYVADNRLENSPWACYEEWSLKHEVHRLLDSALNERERKIVRLYFGLEDRCHTWEAIGKRLGLSRERVRLVGHAAVDKLKHAARNKRLEALLLKY